MPRRVPSLRILALLAALLLILGASSAVSISAPHRELPPVATLRTLAPLAPISRARPAPAASPTAKTVRVAAIQCPSNMGKLVENRRRLTELISQAAQQGAKIVVLPECAVHGYMFPPEDRTWARQVDDDGSALPVDIIGEHVPGPSTRYFGTLAATLGIYLTVPLIEADRGKYFNTVVLMDPEGEIAARHRKNNLWTPGDGAWADAGDGLAQVVASPYGRLGLMLCYDVHSMPRRLRGKADIVLYSVGWYGPNTESWYRETFPQRYVQPNHFAVIAANWAAPSTDDLWQGAGYSSIFQPDGTLAAMSDRTTGNDIIFADLPIAGQ